LGNTIARVSMAINTKKYLLSLSMLHFPLSEPVS
jgi:hypothetical protein